MDLEDYLSLSYTPLKAIESITNIIYLKCNENWNIFDNKITREDCEELLALNFAVKLCAKTMLKNRQNIINKLQLKK